MLVSPYLAFGQHQHGEACATMRVNKMMQRLYPGLAQEQATLQSTMMERVSALRRSRTLNSNQQLEIPLAFHVVWASMDDKVDREKIMEQIEILNNAFSGNDPDFNTNTPDSFKTYQSDVGISFCLGKYFDYDGVLREAITYTQTTDAPFDADDIHQSVKDRNRGGSFSLPSSEYLNIWVAPLTETTAAYATFPGYRPDWQGIVISPTAFGITTDEQRGRGKVLAHEVGHYLFLRHTWGDAECGTDYIDDTPPAKDASRGVFHPKDSFPYRQGVCSDHPHGEMWCNYMTYADDPYRTMFTHNQGEVMRSMLTAGGPRASLLNSKACSRPYKLRATCCPEVEELLQTHVGSRIQVLWLPNPAAVSGYEVRYKAIWHESWSEPETTQRPVHNIRSLPYEKGYSVQVRTLCANGEAGPWATVESYTGDKCMERAPDVQFESDANSITLKWFENPSVDYMSVIVKEAMPNTGRFKVIQDERFKPKGEYTINNLKPTFRYSVTVTWHCLGGNVGNPKVGTTKSWSELIWTTGCVAPPENFEILANSTTVVLRLAAQNPTYKQLTGTIKVNDDNNWPDDITGQPDAIFFLNISADKEYKIRVRAKCHSGEVSEYTYIDFSVNGMESEVVEEHPPTPAQLTLYPNPVGPGQTVVIEPTAGQPQSFNRLLLLNSRGEAVAEQQLGNTNTVQLTLGQLPAGLYLVVLQNGSEITTKRLIIKNK